MFPRERVGSWRAGRRKAAGGLFNICETFILYYNGVISVLCRERNPARQGVAVFCRRMNALLIMIFLLSAPAAFVAGKEPGRPGTVTVEDEALKSARRAALAEIAAAEMKPGAAAALRQKLSDKDPLVRGEAAEAMGRSKDPAALAALTEALRSEDGHTRLGAIGGLAALGDRAAVAPLAGALSHEDRKTRWKAAQALGSLKDARAADALIAAARSDKYRYVRLAAIEALLAIGGAKALPALEELKADQDPEVRAWASAAAERLAR